MVREIRLEEMPASSQPSFNLSSTPPPKDSAQDTKLEMPPREVIEEQAKELERMTPERPGRLQSSLMEFVFVWVTPYPDDLWRKMIAICIVWPTSLVEEWFHFRRGTAVRAAKTQRQHHPFRKQHDLTPAVVDGRSVDLRCTALQDGEPWTDERFYTLVCGHYELIRAKWERRCEQIEYEAHIVREYRKRIARGEMDA